MAASYRDEASPHCLLPVSFAFFFGSSFRHSCLIVSLFGFFLFLFLVRLIPVPPSSHCILHAVFRSPIPMNSLILFFFRPHFYGGSAFRLVVAFAPFQLTLSAALSYRIVQFSLVARFCLAVCNGLIKTNANLMSLLISRYQFLK